jgi:hypothetical protein
VGRPKKEEPQEIVDVSLGTEDSDTVVAEQVTEGEATVAPADPGQEPVTREEFDRAIRSVRDEISGLKEEVADLNNVVTAPVGSVEFLEVTRRPAEPAPEPVSDAPWYTPQHLQ